MAGRGRGKPTMSFNAEQLGISKGEMTSQVMQPPPAYPNLDLHISSFESTNEINYLVELKRDFAEYMRDSLNNVLPDVQKKDIERYSDRYQDTIVDNSEHESKYDWSRMPAELKPVRKLKPKDTNKSNTKDNKKTTEMKIGRKRKRRILDDDDDDNSAPDTKVKPERHKNAKQTQGNPEKQIKEEQEDEEEGSDEDMEDYEEVVDEEMDDGTDYVNNYFDNGEGFDDEDDNLDDGAIY